MVAKTKPDVFEVAKRLAVLWNDRSQHKSRSPGLRTDIATALECVMAARRGEALALRFAAKDIERIEWLLTTGQDLGVPDE